MIGTHFLRLSPQRQCSSEPLFMPSLLKSCTPSITRARSLIHTADAATYREAIGELADALGNPGVLRLVAKCRTPC